MLQEPAADRVPLVMVVELPITGEVIGLIVYPFKGSEIPTRNRPPNEIKFQPRYGSEHAPNDEKDLYPPIDRYRLWTTLLVGIDLGNDFLISLDPSIHQPLRLFSSLYCTTEDARQTQLLGWHAWERDWRNADAPIETVVGCTSNRLVDLVRFERAACGLDPGPRLLLAEQWGKEQSSSLLRELADKTEATQHCLLTELGINVHDLLDVISGAPRLAAAVRGWVAERYLLEQLKASPRIESCIPLEQDGRPDFEIKVAGIEHKIFIECKNVLRKRDAEGHPKLDFQRTRSSKGDPCSRYYAPSDFDIVAACLYPVRREWIFAYRLTKDMELRSDPVCSHKLSQNVRIDKSWSMDLDEVLRRM